MSFRFTSNTTVLDQMVADDAGRDAWLGSVANQGVGNIQLAMTNSPATGKTYGKHIASSPGNEPRVDTGTLRASIKARKIKTNVWAIMTDVLHGFETEMGIGMQARPWMRPEFMRMGVWVLDWAKTGNLI